LGTPLVNPALDEATPENALEQQIWVAEAIGELLAAVPSLSTTPKKENVARALSACVDKGTDGNRAALARILGVPKNTMHLWCSGKVVPQIDAYLRICHRLGWKLSSLLAGTSPLSKAAEIKRRSPPATRPPKPSGKPFDREQILRSLNEALSDNEVPPPPMTEIARRLGYDPRFLRRHFPEPCQRISARYIEYKNEQGRLRTELLCKEIRRITFELYAQGVHPTRRNVGLRLSKPSSFLEEAAQMAHQNALRELGFR
jgi:DNA-binding XRE family transcriptional regulator